MQDNRALKGLRPKASLLHFAAVCLLWGPIVLAIVLLVLLLRITHVNGEAKNSCSRWNNASQEDASNFPNCQ